MQLLRDTPSASAMLCGQWSAYKGIYLGRGPGMVFVSRPGSSDGKAAQEAELKCTLSSSCEYSIFPNNVTPDLWLAKALPDIQAMRCGRLSFTARKPK